VQHVLVIPGSLREGSFSAALARAVCALDVEGVTTEYFDAVRDLPIYDQDLDRDPLPAAAAALRERITAADGLFIVTPEYNYNIPGGLKNAIDWASRPFAAHCLLEKRIAVVGCSPGTRGGKASVEYLRSVVPQLKAHLVGPEVLIPAVNTLVDGNGVVDASVRGRLRDVLSEFVG
jgi:chromate reductase